MAQETPLAAEQAHRDQQSGFRESQSERHQPSAVPAALRRRVIVERLEPEIDGGRFPIKRTVGEPVEVTATIFADGHDVLAAVLRDRHPPGFGSREPGVDEARDTGFGPRSGPVTHGVERRSNTERRQTIDRRTGADRRATADRRLNLVRTRSQDLHIQDVEPHLPPPEFRIPSGWRETPMTMVTPGTDRWTATFDVGRIGWHEYQVAAWVDRFLTWRRELHLKAAAGLDVSVELLEGSELVRDAARRAHEGDTGWLLDRADALTAQTDQAARVAAGLADDLAAAMARYGDRSRATVSATRRVWVDRERARFGAWYEMFPRSAGPDPTRSGTLREACAQLPRIADLGFDILYLPPIHPIGTSFRKGRNNALVAAPGDPGSPWAIGSAAGGHTAIDPGLGTLDDFDAFRSAAERQGLEIALDLAWQCSPDHPWVYEHPEWFRHRADGTIRYAENPPKKYQDIYPLDFESDEWPALWQALLGVTRFWIDRGVKIFRVDNPHTKTFGFWEWLIGEVHSQHPDVLFLSEAFTRPAPLRYLAKAGFTQSYTYFTWRNSKAELTEYFTELTAGELREYLRPNLFANTPDILHSFLQRGGKPAFHTRLLLAATLGASYGIYSGFELAEGEAVPGTEEYADSEKYQYRQWDWDRPGHLNELVARVNQIRRHHPALHTDRTLRFHATDNPEIIAYSKTALDRSEVILVIVNLDPLHMQHGHVEVPLDALHAPAEDSREARSAAVPSADTAYTVRDLIDEVTYEWRGAWNYVRFDPDIRQGHILWLPTHRT
jgi:starch synthase (maltosyl-transferring)